MKWILIFTTGLLLFSCAEKVEKETVENEGNKTEVATAQDISDSGSIPLLNFEAFERQFLKKQNDTTYVVNFWATWCKPCVKELPYFEQLNKNYKDRKVKVILASLDFPDQVQKQVIPFIKKRGLKSETVLLDDPGANSWIPKVDSTWSGAIPATVIYKKGVRAFYEKSFTYGELENELRSGFLNAELDQ
ncbi:MAG: TlpA disulfide reductase family protein [Marinirhabdus sp.]